MGALDDLLAKGPATSQPAAGETGGPGALDALLAKGPAESPGMIGSALRGLAHGATFGFEDEAAGLVGAKDAVHSGYEAAKTAHPVATTVGEFAGMIASPINKVLWGAKAIGAGAKLGARLISGGKQGASGAALLAAGESEGDIGERAKAAVNAAPTGFVFGAGVNAALGKRLAAPATNVGLDTVRAGENIGVDVSRAAAMDSPTTRRVATTAKYAPFSGSALEESSQRAGQQLENAATKIESDFGGGTSQTTQGAGDTATFGLRNWVGTITKSQSKALYDKVDTLVAPHVLTEPLNARKTAGDILAERANAGIGPSAAVRWVDEALSRPNGLNYQGMKLLRTRMGEMISDNILPEGVDRSEFRRIYKALTPDLQSAAQRGGGQRGLDAFNEANQFYQTISEKRQVLAKVLGLKGEAEPEKVLDRIFNAAKGNSSANARLLNTAREAMGPQLWNDVASSAIAKMGRSDSGVGDFDPARFVKMYKDLSPTGKSVLFRSTGRSDWADALDDLAKVSEAIPTIQKYGKPPSSGWKKTTTLGALGATASAVVGGAVAAPLALLGSVVGARVVSNFLAKPATVKSLTFWSRAYNAYTKAKTVATRDALMAASRRFGAEAEQNGFAPADAIVNSIANAIGGEE